MLHPQVTSMILDSVRPSLVLSGDDHDHCTVAHVREASDATPTCSTSELRSLAAAFLASERKEWILAEAHQLLSQTPHKFPQVLYLEVMQQVLELGGDFVRQELRRVEASLAAEGEVEHREMLEAMRNALLAFLVRSSDEPTCSARPHQSASPSTGTPEHTLGTVSLLQGNYFPSFALIRVDQVRRGDVAGPD